MNNKKQISGFTLIELIVVLSIFTILLIFSFPVFKDIRFFSDTTTQTARVAILIQDLKKKAVLKNLDIVLHIDTGSGMMWVSDESMDEDQKETAEKNGFPISEDISIINVEFPGFIKPVHQELEINFSKQGFSDFVIIHCIFDQENISFKIEPFLFEVQIVKGHEGFETCI